MTGWAMIAGVDEAGRGPLAGPVVAAAVVLGTMPIDGLGDSKTKSEAQRERLFEQIEVAAADVGVGIATVAEIERLNILAATMLAMRRAVQSLHRLPVRILVDGKHCPAVGCATEAIVGGDARVPAISAASIVAKVTRDRIMRRLHQQFPQYGFARHKGYPTVAHLRALETCGVSPVHRRTFKPVQRLITDGRD